MYHFCIKCKLLVATIKAPLLIIAFKKTINAFSQSLINKCNLRNWHQRNLYQSSLRHSSFAVLESLSDVVCRKDCPLPPIVLASP